MKKNYFGFLFLLMTAMSFAQSAYRSSANGNWTNIASWEADYGAGFTAAFEYPGQNIGTYTVLIQTGNTITVATNLVTASMGNVTVNGILSLNPNPAPNEITLDTPSLDINGAGAFLNFAANKVKLTLPSGSALSLQNGGDFSGSCTANDEIFIGLNKYAACRGGGPDTYTFGDVVAAGGTINAEIVTPAMLNIDEEVCTLLNIEGGYNGTGSSVTYNWILKDPNGTIVPTSLDSGVLTAALPTDSGVSTFTPSILGDYLLTLEVTEGTFTNVETRTITVTADVTLPVLDAAPADVTVECIGDVPAMINLAWTDNCDGTGTVTGSDSALVGGECGGTITRTWNYTDSCGNPAATRTQIITVDDNTAPVITTCLGNQTVSFDNNCEYTLPNYTSSIVATDNCGSVAITQSPAAGTTITLTTQITITATDDCGNDSTCTFDVIPADNETPTALCQDITVQLSPTGDVTINATDIDNNSYDNCGVFSISVSPDTFDCNDIGDNQVTLTVTDVNGLTSQCTATVTVEDNTAPTNNATDCGTIGPLVIDDVTGDVTVTQAMIDAAYSGTDACGIDTLVLAQTVFGCNDIGTNYNVQLTITDVNGNSSTCGITVIIEAPVISSGSLEGVVLNTGNVETPSDFIAISSCTDLGTSPVEVADDVEMTLTIDPSLIPNIDHWEYSIDDGVTWIPIANTDNTTVYTFNNVTLNTFVRVVILSGDCPQLSPDALIRIVPPDLPPTIISNTALDVCFPDPVTVNAESSIDEYGALNEGGLFNTANLNNLGWIVDGAAEMSAGGNNTNNTYWKETNGPKNFNGRCYDTTDNTKFAIVSGNSIYDAPDHTIAPLSTLETPIFSTVGLPEAILHFDQAYYLETGAWITVELSYDGGATYTETLNPGTATNTVPPNTGPLTFNYTGPSNSGFMDQGFNGGGCNNSDGTFVNHATEITLPLGEAGLRIKFTYSGTANSVWALDNIRIPYSPVEEVLEWEDDLGNITYGNTITRTPITPGAQQVGVTALVNDCRADNDDGTTFVTFNASLGYAGQPFTSPSGECGQSTIDLKAYDNTKTALENYNYGAYEPGLYTYPGELIDHDNNAGTATIPAPNYPGTGVTGSWSLAIVSQECATFAPTFDSATDPWTKFTAPPGIYDLTWTLGIGCSDVIRVTINSCNNLNFDGTDDFVSFKNNYALNSPFSIETWVKPNSITGNNTILSKRLATSTDAGYDLSLESNGRVRFNWFTSGADGYIESDYSISTNRWYHIAVTFDGSSYLLYIDGIEVGTVTGTINAPDSTGRNVECLLGALDPSVGTSALATRHFNGWIDELRIWNKAITENQIRYMMNQEIMDNGAVRGEVVPQDIPGLTWATDLYGYYRMDVGCGDLSSHGGKGPNGRLRNIFTDQQETAPLPYTSAAIADVTPNDWFADNTWTHFGVWDPPNSIGIDNRTIIDWNIVQLSHNVISNGDIRTINSTQYPDREDNQIVVLGLISDTTNKTLTITNPNDANQDETNNGKYLRVTHYLELDGNMKLVGQSQLLQDFGSELAISSAGTLERHQQGTLNPTNYNYWAAPVGTVNTTANNVPYTVPSVLRDGTNLNSLSTITFDDGAIDPVLSGGNLVMAGYWLWYYNNRNDTEDEQENYDAWQYLGSSGTIKVGLGYTMKGTNGLTGGSGEQNYAFIGKPNNGDDINFDISADHQTLLGNPYPSAIDAHKFIIDNGPAGTNSLKDGALYFWEHYPLNNTHYLEDYEGGYATRNLVGGIGAPILSTLTSGITIPDYKRPGQYIPVAQGFFVQALEFGAGTRTLNFNNSQRVFYREGVDLDSETGDDSVFFSPNNNGLGDNYGASSRDNNVTNQIIRRLRLNFNGEGYSRELLLGFTSDNAATDNVDYGYDAIRYDSTLNDIAWQIDKENFVIQGVGEFNTKNEYPLNVTIINSGKAEFSIATLDNFESPIEVYIYDAILGTYNKINDEPFEIILDAGEYIDRFYLTFENEESLNLEDNTIDSIRLYYLNDTKEIYINWVNSYDIKEVKLINILGQEVKHWDNINPINSHEIKIPVKNISEGNYVIKVINHHGMTTNKKVIIKR
ncbi:MAG: hypothetical protein DA407_10300 [Bacteroidetes bacterium]|nr:MAG: hypothetical protein DA407_10300 [Bacteroidota bacterium]